MSNDNVKLVQEGYAAFGRGDIPFVLDRMTSDVTMGIVGRPEDLELFGIRAGKAGAQEFFRLLNETHEIHTFVPDRFLGAEDKVFVWGHYSWTMRRSGVSKESSWLHELTIRDGMICAWHGHNDTAMLMAAYHGQPAKRAANG
jgi:uncharacterized protein